MSYRLEPEETLSVGLKRIVLEQLDRTLEQLHHPGEQPDEVVHDVRKRFKKIRAVLRLVRDTIGEDRFKKENVCFRDAGRTLAPVRDNVVNIETLDALTAQFHEQLASGVFSPLQTQLHTHAQRIRQQRIIEQEAFQETAAIVQAARLRVPEWTKFEDELAVISKGLKRVYKRGRKGLQRAYKSPSGENFHEWRKRVKYLWYQTRILRLIWPNMQETFADELHRLSNYLGDDHDLVALQDTLSRHETFYLDEHTRQTLFALIVKRQEELRTEARPLGERIYAEKPSDVTDRMAAYWKISHVE